MRTHSHVSNFWKHVEKTEGCWLWIGNLNAYGYGNLMRRFYGKKKGFMAHRVSWEIHNGAIPAGLSVLHKCDVTNCVKPDHLFLGTQADNNRDRHAKGRSKPGGKKVSACPKGHAYDEINTRYSGPRKTHRTCRACDRERGRYGFDR